MPQLLQNLLKPQAQQFLRDNDQEFPKEATKEALIELIRKLLTQAGIEPSLYDFETNRVLSAGPAVTAKALDLPPPAPFCLEPAVSACVRWEKWTKSFDFYKDAALAISSPEKLRSVFLHVAGAEVQELWASLVEDSAETNAFKRALKALDAYFQPQRNVRYERYEFSQLRQAPQESSDAFAARLRGKAAHCDFGTQVQVDDRLLDQYLAHCHDSQIRKKLLLEGSTLTFGKAMEMARATEGVQKQMSAFQPKPSSSIDMVAKESKPSTWVKPDGSGRRPDFFSSQRSRSAPRPLRPCAFCEEKHVFRRDLCPARDAVCKICRQEGHFPKSRACPKAGDRFIPGSRKPSVNPKSIRHVAAESNRSATSSDEDDASYVSAVTPRAGVYASLDVAKVGRVRFLVDSGAATDLMPLSLLPPTVVPTPAPDLRLRAYNGTPVPTLGRVELRVTNQRSGQKELVSFAVVEEDTAVLGHDTALKLKLISFSDLCVSIRQVSRGMEMAEKWGTLLERYAEVFGADLGLIKGIQVRIRLKEEAKPVFARARPVPFSLVKKVDETLDKAVASGSLEKVESSQWSSPTVNVMKPNGDVRVCSDFKATLNGQVFMDNHPFPTMDSLVAKFSGAKFFAKLDFSRMFEQFAVHPDDRECLTINTHRGLYRHTRLPYGLCVSPMVAQRECEKLVLNLFPEVYVWIDDILIGAKTELELLERVDLVLSKLRSVGARLNKDKCVFGVEKISYLGYMISKDGIETDPKKVQCIVGAQAPANKKELKSWMGLIQYYGRFCSRLSETTSPLRDLLGEKVPFNWSAECEEAFQKVKQLITSAPILAFYDDRNPLLLHCDASAHGLGVVLSTVVGGVERPIAFAHRALSTAEKNYAQIDRESLSIVFGVTYFHKFVYGRHFTIVTDHRPLVRIFGPKSFIPPVAAARLTRYAILLSQYVYDIQFKKGQAHGNADCLSRLPAEPQAERTDPAGKVYVRQLALVPAVTAAEIIAKTSTDPLLARVYERILHGWGENCPDPTLLPFFKKRSELAIHNGAILWGGRVVVPAELRVPVLEKLHLGHPGIVRMRQLARGSCWWPGIDADVELKSQSCDACLSTQNLPPRAEVMSWPTPKEPWSRIHIDYAPRFHGQALLIIVDAQSKWVEVECTRPDAMDSEKTIRLLEKSFSRFGYPKTVVSDNGSNFTSDTFRTYMESIGVRQKFSAPGHPATNGAAERTVQSVKKGIERILLSGKSRDVQAALQQWLFTYRYTPQATTGLSPAELFLGRKIRSPLSVLVPTYQHPPLPALDGTSRQKPQRIIFLRGNRMVPGRVISVEGPRHLVVEAEDGSHHRRHRDHVRVWTCGP